MVAKAWVRRIIWISIALTACFNWSWADPTLFLADPQLSANVQLNLAKDAESEVLMASYVFNLDRAGLMKLATLRNVARQEKRAVLLLDDFGSKIPKDILSYLAEEGVEIYLYHPFSWKNPLQYLRRNHLKLYVVDGKHLVTGDRNSGVEYFGLSNKSSISRDVYVSGKAAQDAKAHIEELIQSDEVVRFKGSKLNPFLFNLRRRLFNDVELSSLMRRLRKNTTWKDKVFESDAVEFYHDPVGKKGVAPGVDKKVIEAIEKAQKQITFENPYVALPDALKSALERAAKRGVKIRALTNSIESADSKLVGIAWEKSRTFLASIGAEVWEHSGSRGLKKPQMSDVEAVEKFRRVRAFLKEIRNVGLNFDILHAKTMLIDEADSYIMSYNFDPRSEKLNMEAATYIKGEKFAQFLSSEIEKDLVQANYRLVAADGKLRLPENAAKPSCLMRALARILESQL